MQLRFKSITYRISEDNTIESYYFWGRLKSESIDINSITSISEIKKGLFIIYRVNGCSYSFIPKLSADEVELMKNELLKRNPSIEVEN